MKKIFSMMMVCLLTASVCQAQSYRKEAIDCLGTEGDGSQTLRVTGIGKNKADAIEQAKKDAVAAVIFEGIHGGMSGCETRPLTYERDARRNHEDYFDVFFRDNGMYSQFVTFDDRKIRSNTKVKNKAFKSYRVTVRVLRPELKRRLQEDGIIK